MTREASFIIFIIASLLLTAAATAQDQDMTQRPTHAIQRWVHDSGAAVFLVEKHDLPWTTVSIMTRTGSNWDPTPGLASITAQLMRRGAGELGRSQLDVALESLGATLSIDTAKSVTAFEVDTLSRNIDAVMGITADVLLRPTLSAEELARLKRERRGDILMARDNDSSLSHKFFSRYLYGAHPQGSPTPGTLKGLESIDTEAVKTFYNEHITGSNLMLGFTGDITRAQVEAILKKHFATIPTGAPKPLSLKTPKPLRGRQILLIDKPTRTQNQIVIGHLAPDSTEFADHYSMELVNTLFGGTFTARLNHEIREKRGLSYGAYSQFAQGRFSGAFKLWTSTASQDAMTTLRLALQLTTELYETPLKEEEVEFVKRYLTNAFAFRIDTPRKLLDEVMRTELQGFPPDYLDTYVTKIEEVTVEDANAAIKRRIDPDNLLIVMLCTATGFEEVVQSIHGATTVRVVPFHSAF